jgi:transposase InsO family protein
MLVELSVVEQRYHAVMEVLSGAPVTEVARRYGVSRQSVHNWLSKYRAGGLAALADHSHRPCFQPRQIDADAEAVICRLRGAHPRWGPRRLRYEIGKAGVSPVPSRSTVYRVLVRHGLVQARRRKRRRQDYKRWQREAPMELWQLDVTGSVFLADGAECKLISGIDDHSRFCVIAVVVRRATGRAVCRAFVAAMRAYGIPEEVLSDNGKQFTGRFGKPRPAEVLFERICRRNGITQRLTKPYSPTTTGKVERWHQTLQLELLNGAGPFACVKDAQTAVDAWREEYNRRRPHQSLDMACPADKFRASPANDGLELWAPPDLELVTAPAASSPDAPVTAEPVRWPDAIEIDRVVPASGNMSIGPQQFWLGTRRAGEQVRFWVDTTTVHLSIDGWRVKTVPSRLSAVDIVRLRQAGGRPAGPPPAGPAPGALAATSCVEVQRLVNSSGIITLANQVITVGSPLAGQRPHPPGRPGHARHHPRRRAVAHPAVSRPARRPAQAAGRAAGRAAAAAACQPAHPAESIQPRRHPGRPPARPRWLAARRTHRHHRARRHHAAGYRPQRRAARHRAQERHRRNQPVQGLRQ